MSTHTSHRSYALTLRPLNGVTDSQISVLTKWIKDKCEYYYVITEKLAHERHVHASIFLKKPVSRSNISVMLCRLKLNLNPEEKAVFQRGIKNQYNADWLGKYMEKGDDTVIIERNLPEAGTLDSYFSEVPSVKKKGPASADPYYTHLEKLWYQHKRAVEECNPVNLRHFLMRMMNVERVIRVIGDNKKIFSLSCSLARFINREDTWRVEADCFHQDV